MKAFVVSTPGFEEVTVSEVREFAPSASSIKAGAGIVFFEVSEARDLCILAYRFQSALRVCVLLASFRVHSSIKDSVGSLMKSLKGFRLSDWTDEESFSVEVSRSGSHDFTSHDFLIASGKEVSKLSGSHLNLKAPAVRLYCLIEGDQGFFGVDIAGFDLGRRDYRIFGHSSDLRATAAYSLLRIAGFGRGRVLLDPFSRSGAVSIEATLFASGTSPNYYRKDSFSFLKLKPFAGIDFSRLFGRIDGKADSVRLPIFNYSPSIAYVRSAEKNAKIAGVNKLMSFGRIDMEFIDLKFEKGSVDFIVSYPPFLSRSSDDSKVRKAYSELFRQASFILSRKGRIVLAVRDTALAKETASGRFSVMSERAFSMGEEQRTAILFAKA